MKQEAKNINSQTPETPHQKKRNWEMYETRKGGKGLPIVCLFKGNYTIHTFDPQISNINKAQGL